MIVQSASAAELFPDMTELHLMQANRNTNPDGPPPKAPPLGPPRTTTAPHFHHQSQLMPEAVPDQSVARQAAVMGHEQQVQHQQQGQGGVRDGSPSELAGSNAHMAVPATRPAVKPAAASDPRLQAKVDQQVSTLMQKKAAVRQQSQQPPLQERQQHAVHQAQHQLTPAQLAIRQGQVAFQQEQQRQQQQQQLHPQDVTTQQPLQHVHQHLNQHAQQHPQHAQQHPQHAQQLPQRAQQHPQHAQQHLQQLPPPPPPTQHANMHLHPNPQQSLGRPQYQASTQQQTAGSSKAQQHQQQRLQAIKKLEAAHQSGLLSQPKHAGFQGMQMHQELAQHFGQQVQTALAGPDGGFAVSAPNQRLDAGDITHLPLGYAADQMGQSKESVDNRYLSSQEAGHIHVHSLGQPMLGRTGLQHSSATPQVPQWTNNRR